MKGRKRKPTMKYNPVPSSAMVTIPTGRMRVSPQVPPQMKSEKVATPPKNSSTRFPPAKAACGSSQFA